VGKSTLIDALGGRFTSAGHRVAVLAVDPTSPRSGGSILGDKTRMTHLSVNPAAFVRPTATSGSLGGVARRTRESITLCEAAGYDRVLVETVGVGQSELAVDGLTDLTLLLMIGGAGDELQGIKRGIMESADIIAVTKADGEGVQRAEQAVQELRSALPLLPPRASGRRAEVLRCSAITGEGLSELVALMERLAKEDAASGTRAQRRAEQARSALRGALELEVLDALHRQTSEGDAWSSALDAVGTGRTSARAAARDLLSRLRTGGAPLP
jgi:LAO/AO transport system kinase